MRLLPMGPRAVLVDRLDADPAAWSIGLRQMALPGVVDVVPAAATVLVTCATGAALAAVMPVLASVAPGRHDTTAGGVDIEIPVRYDGPDLDWVASTAGLTVDEVVERHSAVTYTVAFCGFAPGFAYLRGLDPALRLPRRSTPRTSVPAGSVAIAADYSAVYPSASPGGWHLLGITDAVMFDVERVQPALLVPGAAVRFVPR